MVCRSQEAQEPWHMIYTVYTVYKQLGVVRLQVGMCSECTLPGLIGPSLLERNSMESGLVWKN